VKSVECGGQRAVNDDRVTGIEKRRQRSATGTVRTCAPTTVGVNNAN